MAAQKIDLTSEAGQTLIEAVAALFAVSGLITVLIVTLWMGFVKVRIDHEMHEAIVCRWSHKSAGTLGIARSQSRDCEFRLKEKISALPWHPVLRSLQWKKSKNEMGLVIELEQKYLRIWNASKIRFSKFLTIPLLDFEPK